MQDISGFGTTILLRASVTYPVGLPHAITEFPDDTDPFDLPELEIAQAEMGLNGDMIVWAKAAPIIITLNLIPGSVSDLALMVLAEQNRIGRGKQSVGDRITLTRIWPNNIRAPLVLAEGRLTNAPAGTGVASSGRMKTNAYTFKFERKSGF